MKKWLALLAVPVALSGAKAHDWKTGTVLDSKTTKTYVQTGSSTQATGTATTTGTTNSTFTQTGNTGSSSGTFDSTARSHEASETQIHGMNLQESQLVIVTADFLFVVSDTVEKGHLEMVITAEAWRIVAKNLATIHGLDRGGLYSHYSQARDIVNSIPLIATLKTYPKVSHGEIVEVLKLSDTLHL